MKTKIIILVVITAVATLSFTFVRVQHKSSMLSKSNQTNSVISAPVGGFAIVDKN